MSEEQHIAEEQDFIGPGAMLRQARIKAGLSASDIADKLHLKVHSIERLESDDYDETISMTFTKGYLKLYAKHIQVPEQDVLQAFEKMNNKGKEPAKLQSFSRRVAKQASDDRLMLVTYLVIVAVIVLVFVWWWQKPASDVTSSSAVDTTPVVASERVSPAPAEQQTATDNVNTLNQNTDDQPAGSQQAKNNAPAEQGEGTEVESSLNIARSLIEEAGSEPQSDTDEPQSADPTESNVDDLSAEAETMTLQQSIEMDAQRNRANTGNSESGSEDGQSSDVAADQAETTTAADFSDVEPVELVFEFADDCWMNLTDATGEAIAYGTKAAGRVMPVSGIPPFEVTLGAPEVVQIRYNGEPVDMSGFRGGRSATFSLPLSEE